jgi:hypothetical protein
LDMMHNRMLYGYRNTTAIVRMPEAIALYVFGPTIGATATAIFATQVAVSLVTSWALQALSPSPSFGSGTSAGILVNGKGPAEPQQFVYGQVRKGGVVTYYEASGGDNRFLHQIIVLAGHEVDEIGDIYINDEVVTFDGDFVTGKWASKVRIQKFRGDQTTAPADLLAESNQISPNFIGRGIAYLYVRYEYDQDVFANGIPLITAVVKGKRVFDPRTSTTAYSNNAALCVRDYLTAAYGMKTTDVDDTAFSIAANVCDEDIRLSTIVDAGNFVVGEQYEIKTVGTTDFVSVGASANTIGEVFVATGAGSGTGDAFESEPRYTMNGLARADQKHNDVLGNMMTACAGTLFWGGGKFILRAAAYTAPTKVLTLDDLRSQISLDTRTNLRDQFNYVQGTFNDADQRWITVDYPPFKSSVFEAEDGGEEMPLDLELPMTTSGASAQRIAKLTLFRGREQMTLTADFGLNALDVEVGEIIALTIDRYGWVEKEFEVVGWKFGPNQDAGDLRISLSLRETSEAAFDWNAEEGAIVSNNTNLPDAFRAIPFGLNVTSEVRIVNEHLTNVIFAEVTSSEPFNIDRVEVQFRKTGETGFKIAGVGQLGTFEILDTEDATYDIRARTYSVLGVRSEFDTRSNFVVAGLAFPPANVTGLTAEINGASVHLEWEPVPDLDLSFYRIRHAAEETGATWANATTAVDKVPRPANSVTVPAKPGSYMIRAFDKTGNASGEYTTVVIPAAALEGFATTLTQSEHPTFAGTKTGCSVVSGELLITDVTGTPPFTATYEFGSSIDTGAVRRFRSRIDVQTRRLDNSAGLWDDLGGLFDELPGNFDDFTGAAQFADTNVVTYIATTNDDPAGTPTWTDWQKFRAGDFYARAAKFKIDLISTATNVTPAVDTLIARVEHN